VSRARLCEVEYVGEVLDDGDVGGVRAAGRVVVALEGLQEIM
jgi:hypothetical protein